MFKKLKDKIAEEVKSSPQRIQQFAQAAQAAVTSASSSISDITNNDLFTIADDETPQNSPHHSKQGPPSALSPPGFQDVSLSSGSTPSPLRTAEAQDSLSPLTNHHHHSPPPAVSVYPAPPSAQRLRKLSNSSNASDVSFRLPSYESPGAMYHLQSDLDVSASEMEDSMSVPAQLERVSKEQLFAAYRRSNEKYNKYRGRYTDLARHYRNLERENAKARAVLVETQDKALRRISELREQCSLEQSAKAHLESALRLELDERNLKIEALNTKIKLLQSFSGSRANDETDQSSDISREAKQQETHENGETFPTEQQKPLIDFSSDQSSTDEVKQDSSLAELEGKHSTEIYKLNDKIQKLEQLLAKCKEAIKTHKEKNSQLTSELQIVSTQLDKKHSENEQLLSQISQLETISVQYTESMDQVVKLKEELSSFERKKVDEFSSVQEDLKVAKQEIAALTEKMDVLNRREEENVISLAENKLSVHKELESKENEIKILKDKISAANLEIKSSEAIIQDLKLDVRNLEDDKIKMNEQLANFAMTKEQITNLDAKINELKLHNSELDGKCSSLLENIKCKELELKQEIDEKLAIKDRNNFLEGRNKHLGDENTKKNKHIADLEREIMDINKQMEEKNDTCVKYETLLGEQSKLKSEHKQILECKESLENELNNVNSKCHDISTNVESMSIANGALSSQIDKLTADIKHINQEKDTMEELCRKSNEDFNKLKEELTNCKKTMNSQIEELENKLKTYSENSESQEVEITQKINKELMQENESSEIKNKYDESLLELKRMETEHMQLKEVIIDKEKELEIVANEKIQIQNNYDALNIEKIDLESKLGTFNGLVVELKELKVLNEELLKEKLKFELKMNELDDAIKERNQLKNVYEELLTKEKNKFILRLGELDATIVELTQVKNINEELIKEKDVLQSKMTEFDEVMKEKNNLAKNNNELVRENKCLETKYESFISETEILRKECEQLRLDKSDLEEKVAALESENRDVKGKTSALIEDIRQLQKEIIAVQESHSQIVSQKNVIEEKISLMEKSDADKISAANQHSTEISELKQQVQELHSDKDKLICDKSELLEKQKFLQDDLESSKLKLKEYSENNEVWQMKLSNILDENNTLQEKCARLKHDKDTLTEKVTGHELKLGECELMKKRFEEFKLEMEFLNMRISQLENDLSQVTGDKNQLLLEKESMQKEFSNIANDRKAKLDNLNEDLTKLKSDFVTMQEEKTEMQNRLDNELSEKQNISSKLQELEDKVKDAESLIKDKSILEVRFTELQEKCKNLETNSYEEISTLQTTNSDLTSKCEKLKLKCHELEEQSQSYASIESRHEDMIVKLKILEQVENEHKSMIEEFDTLKSENGKLKSDIEGLQTHLTKVSKDNSQLNDRIRELEASGEVMQMSYQQNLDSSPSTIGGADRLSMQVQLNKLTEANAQLLEELKSNENLHSKLLDLERQNSILIDEKLELQDQIHSSMDRHDRIAYNNDSDKDFELNSLRTQIKDVLNEKMDLEGRLADLELISRSGDSNMKALEQKNEKLLLMNEKLERRLDEALVSLNHIRTMEENTELEYLRNILYEYLTGPTNNNLVLAKVLAAVVKFDQRQTQLVLEREKEKQGLLGQLGLL